MITVRLDLKPGAQAEQVWDKACANLAEYLMAQGVAGIEITRAAEAPERSLTSGKFRQVIAGTRTSGP